MEARKKKSGCRELYALKGRVHGWRREQSISCFLSFNCGRWMKIENFQDTETEGIQRSSRDLVLIYKVDS